MLTLELLTWIASRDRTYAEAMDAWRSNCPRHPVWEDALAGGLIQVVESGETMDESKVILTAAGKAVLGGNAVGPERRRRVRNIS
jgi:hypothetical protein